MRSVHAKKKDIMLAINEELPALVFMAFENHLPGETTRVFVDLDTLVFSHGYETNNYLFEIFAVTDSDYFEDKDLDSWWYENHPELEEEDYIESLEQGEPQREYAQETFFQKICSRDIRGRLSVFTKKGGFCEVK